MSKTAIIGAGAAGLSCAVFLKSADKNADVTLFERLDRVGKKILATGNGRCNLSNIAVGATDSDGNAMHYYGRDRRFVLPALRLMPVEKLREIFLTMNLATVFEGDKLFPASLNAAGVLDILRFRADALGVKIKTGEIIEKIGQKSGKFIINGELFDNCVVAAGGKAQENLGSNGSGYKLLRDFGHTLNPTFPAITQIKTETEFVRQLKGLKIDAECVIYVDENEARREFGQVLFADYGLSGPPIFALSRIASEYKNRCKIVLDLLPNYTEKEIEKYINGVKNDPVCHSITLENVPTGIINKRIGGAVIKYAGYKLSTPLASLNERDISAIVTALKHFSLNVTGVGGYNVAQVTAGGIDTADFDSESFQSRIKNGLYAIGEVLDVDGDCGGYNLHFAFASAYCCAAAITRSGK